MGTEFNSVPLSWSHVRSSRTRDAGYPYAIVKDLRLPKRVKLASLRARWPRLLDERAYDWFSENPILMELMGIEPTTSGLQNRRSPS